MVPSTGKKRSDLTLMELLYGGNDPVACSCIDIFGYVALSTGPEPERVVDTLLHWFEQRGRSFSWRAFTDPFHVLIAEILLRKTTAQAVERYVLDFLVKYPTAEKLAEAGMDDITGMLGALGLGQQRARQMLELSKYLMQHYGGRIPRGLPDLLQLPGVGTYTACMVGATCFSWRVLPVDTNVARLICRIWELKPSNAEARKSRNVWEMASVLACCSTNSTARLAWSLLDLAAEICTSRKPKCANCPLRSYCVFAIKASN